ncbi:MAG: tRNA (adenosine(37)-N6)-dimethylallyltransferase MiaA [Oscillospiraceae bacterium]|nr:tRNA (adenosine(37)-N6)-dimethylallyltransferase MiaA [Oscillospiraceae bacterium]
MTRNKILVIAGPTASGKTRLGIELARQLDGEIVSADSMQVYRGMDIGTAKADAEERAAAVHHMLDVAEPAESYSVARYVEDAGRCVDDILARRKLPIVVGGTGLYIDSLIAGRDFAENTGDGALRAALSARYDAIGGEAMLQELSAFDPERARKLHSGDKRRIVRAVEIYRLTGKTATAHDAETRARPPRYQAARIVLNYADRAALYRRIDRRVEEMAARGLFQEVSGLLDAGLSPDCTAMQAIGYKEAVQCLKGELTENEAVALIQQNSRRYAKRQLTWFGRWEDAHRIVWEAQPDFEAARQSSTRFLISRGYHG